MILPCYCSKFRQMEKEPQPEKINTNTNQNSNNTERKLTIYTEYVRRDENG